MRGDIDERPPTRERLRERFTERARHAFEHAGEEAARLGHAALACEHVLLALVHEGEGIGVTLLERFCVNLEDLCSRVERAAAGPQSLPAGAPPTGYSPSVLSLSESAIGEALGFRHNYVGSEHVLIALASESSGIPAAVLGELGVSAAGLRRELRILYKE